MFAHPPLYLSLSITPLLILSYSLNFPSFHLQVDSYTTESVVSVDWENGFVEASAKENENVNKVL